MMPSRSRRIDSPESENAMEVPRKQGKFQSDTKNKSPLESSLRSNNALMKKISCYKLERYEQKQEETLQKMANKGTLIEEVHPEEMKRNINLLDKINNIDEDCLEDEQEISDINIETAENA
ncbi:hypothetical protein HZH68_014663 [Vespula germanica]|uniref:Uncharacterized protein n=1 Tax=Vespula germanica TaxID=30212 RepID=A0A834JAC2_VESGE|nr:hypothetical protein HZH68_014663 [Vespula germanica]